MSARRSSVDTSWPCSGNSEIPMLALTRKVTPSTENGGSSALRMPSATDSAPRGVDSDQQHRELVAAQAGQHLAGAVQVLAQPVGHQLEQGVTGVVAEAVVDLLEPVQVEQQQRAGAAPARASCSCALS